MRIDTLVYQGFMSGGAGYVLSKEAMNRMRDGMKDGDICRLSDWGDEDVEIAKCLENVGVLAGDSRDLTQKNSYGRFFPVQIERHLLEIKKKDKYWKNMYYKGKHRENCCSDNAISFHYVTFLQYYLFEYFIYKLTPYGVHPVNNNLPIKISFDDLKRKFRKNDADVNKFRLKIFKHKMMNKAN